MKDDLLMAVSRKRYNIQTKQYCFYNLQQHYLNYALITASLPWVKQYTNYKRNRSL